MKRTSMLTLATIISMVMILFLALPAFAEDETTTFVGSTGTEDSPAAAAVTKIIKTPIGTDTPVIDFTFEFTNKGVGDENDVPQQGVMPSIAAVTIGFTATDKGSTTGATTLIPKEELIVLNGLNWGHAGKFYYTVKEKQMAAYTPPRENSFMEEWTYSGAEYTLIVVVANGVGGLYVSDVVAVIEKKDADTIGNVGDKVDPTPGGSSEGDYSKLIFNNRYLKNNGGTNPNNTVLEISKDVAGAEGDRSKYFQYSITVTNPEMVVNAAKTYKAYVLDANGAVADISQNGLGTGKIIGNYIEFTTGVPLTVYLKHGQKFSFTDLPVGSAFTVTESANAGYLPSYEITLNGDTPVNSPSDVAKGDPLSIALTRITEGKDEVAYTNEYVSNPLTGISVENLPYVILIIVALLALASYLVIKSRRNAKFDF
jgi:hypothetical protein